MGAASGWGTVKSHISCTGTPGSCVLQAAAVGVQQLKVASAENASAVGFQNQHTQLYISIGGRGRHRTAASDRD